MSPEFAKNPNCLFHIAMTEMRADIGDRGTLSIFSKKDTSLFFQMGKKIFYLGIFSGEETDKLQLQNAWVRGNQPEQFQPLPGCKGLSGFSKASPPCFAYKRRNLCVIRSGSFTKDVNQYAIGTHSLSASLFHSFSGCQVFQFYCGRW